MCFFISTSCSNGFKLTNRLILQGERLKLLNCQIQGFRGIKCYSILHVLYFFLYLPLFHLYSVLAEPSFLVMSNQMQAYYPLELNFLGEHFQLIFLKNPNIIKKTQQKSPTFNQEEELKHIMLVQQFLKVKLWYLVDKENSIR